MITKKHFFAIAKILGHNNITQKTNPKLISQLSDYFEIDNPRFDIQRFKEEIEKQYNKKNYLDC